MQMQIDVPDKKLRKILSNNKEIRKKYNILDKKIMARISMLQTVDNLNQVPTDQPERCHLLDHEYKGCYAISIKENWRLIIKPDGYDMPYNKEEITKIKIMDIVDYHNK